MRDAYVRAITHAQDDINLLNLYPTFIVETRYSGVYEGGRWASFPSVDRERTLPQDAFGDDSDCLDFWLSEEADRIGRGNTPSAAYMDMLERIKKFGELDV